MIPNSITQKSVIIISEVITEHGIHYPKRLDVRIPGTTNQTWHNYGCAKAIPGEPISIPGALMSENDSLGISDFISGWNAGLVQEVETTNG